MGSPHRLYLPPSARAVFWVKGHEWKPGHAITVTFPHIAVGVPLALSERVMLTPRAQLGLREYNNDYYKDSLGANNNADWPRTTPKSIGASLEMRHTLGQGPMGFFTAFLVQYERILEQGFIPELSGDMVRLELRCGFLIGKQEQVP